MKVKEKEWRRGWDSNPRLSFPNTRFPSVLLKPLGHLSVPCVSSRLEDPKRTSKSDRHRDVLCGTTSGKPIGSLPQPTLRWQLSRATHPEFREPSPEPDLRIVFQHPAHQVAHDRLRDMIRNSNCASRVMIVWRKSWIRNPPYRAALNVTPRGLIAPSLKCVTQLVTFGDDT